jgi:hypothetical protein
MTCLLCTNDIFSGVLMDDQHTLVTIARQVIHGMASAMGNGNSLKSFQPKRRRGICIVERCARLVEASCAACRDATCPRCTIAAELRAAEDQINAERDAELAVIGVSDEDIEEAIDRMVGGLCKEHVAFGAVIVGEWHDRQTLVPPTPDLDPAADTVEN